MIHNIQPIANIEELAHEYMHDANSKCRIAAIQSQFPAFRHVRGIFPFI